MSTVSPKLVVALQEGTCTFCARVGGASITERARVRIGDEKSRILGG